jgi:predicted enzyme related to lactoylglutathione lyase
MAAALRRATVFVADLARATAFYTGVFGFAVYRDLVVDLGRMPDMPIGPTTPAGSARFAILKGHDPLFGMIGLLEVRDPPLAEVDHRRLGRGNVALVLSADSIDAVAEAIPRLGGTLLTPATAGRNLGDETGAFVPVRMLLAYDPDGHFLEIFEPT